MYNLPSLILFNMLYRDKKPIFTKPNLPSYNRVWPAFGLISHR